MWTSASAVSALRPTTIRASALRGLGPEQRGWQAETRSVRCQNCNAISVLSPQRVAQRCDFCGSPAIVPLEEQQAPIRPSSLLPFTVPEASVRKQMRRWYATRWFAPNKLRRWAITDTLKGVYLPYWTFDAQVHADWTAESGYYYYETETYVANGETRTRQVQRVRWVPAAGHVSHFFDDDLVCASVGVAPGLLRGIEPFPTQELKPYDAGYVAGWVVERYQIDLVGAAQRARAAMDAKLQALCAREIPGDTFRNLVVHADYSKQTFKHTLAPVWLLTYNYGARRFQCVMNGVTGAVRGEYPKSPWKIALLVVAIFIVVVIVMSLVGKT